MSEDHCFLAKRKNKFDILNIKEKKIITFEILKKKYYRFFFHL